MASNTNELNGVECLICLGPSLFESRSCRLQHLHDTTTYTLLTKQEASNAANHLYHQIFQWTRDHRQTLDTDTVNYIRRHIEKNRADPFGYFYLPIKLHIRPISMHPVCPNCVHAYPMHLANGSINNSNQLFKINQGYFKNSSDLKCLLNTMTSPPNACIFTYDAISMYTNINTSMCLDRLCSFLTNDNTTSQYQHLSPMALTKALHIVMKNNRMRFGDLFALQHKGIVMGMSPAPIIANLFVAIYDNNHLLSLTPPGLFFPRRFINDCFGIWHHPKDKQQDDTNWTSFQCNINDIT